MSLKTSLIGPATPQSIQSSEYTVSPMMNNRLDNEISATRLLYNYLCLEGEDSLANQVSEEDYADTVQIFEDLIYDELVQLPDDCKLKKLLQQHGWHTNSFTLDFDLYQLQRDLGNLYLASTIAETGESEDFTFRMFCPDILLQILERQYTESDIEIAESSTSFFGTCLLADISGFTTLASSLCTVKRDMDKSLSIGSDKYLRDYLKSKRNNASSGLDELRLTTNTLLGSLVQIIYAHGGDVIAFAGDALLCVFTDDFAKETRTEHHSIRALKCSVQLAATSISCNDKALSMHNALSCGEMSLSIMGGWKKKWVYALMGSCVSDLSGCITNAKSKETVMTADLHRLIESNSSEHPGLQYSAKPLDSGHFRLNHSPLRKKRPSGENGLSKHMPGGSPPIRRGSSSSSPAFEERKKQWYLKASCAESNDLDDVTNSANASRNIASGALISNLIQPFVPAPICAAIDTECSAISELRQVTTMFLQLDSYSADMNSNPLILQPFILMVQRLLDESGGFMRQFLVDDKGCVLIGMWGVPTFSHRNNAILALKCSLQIQEELKSIGHRCSIGLTTGLVFCGSIGSCLRKDYVGIGDKVNFAARLMSKAKGRILVDELTQAYVPIDVRKCLVRAEVMKLKGIVADFRPFMYVGTELPEPEEEDINLAEILSEIRSDITDKVKNQLDRLSGHYVRTDTSRALQKEWAAITQRGRVALTKEDRGNSDASSALTEESPTAPTKRPSLIARILENKRLSKIQLEKNRVISFNQKNNYVNYIIIEGIEGLSLSKLAENYKAHVKRRRRKISSYFVEGIDGDQITPYGVISRLIMSIIKDKMKTDFNDEFEQRNILKRLLLKKQPDLSSTILLEQLGGLQSALSLTWAEEINVDEDISVLNSRVELVRLESNRLIESTSPLMHILDALLEESCSAFVIENAHYCDEFSWLILRMIQLSDNINAVAFIMMYPLNAFTISRNSGLSITSIKSVLHYSTSNESTKCTPLSLESILKSPNTLFIDFKLFEKADVNTLVCKILEVESIDSRIIDAVFEISNANPVWCTELALFIKTRGIEQFSLNIKSRSENPLAALIAYRFDALSANEQTVVKYASVIGDNFTSKILYSIIPSDVGMNENELEKTLACLEKLGFIYGRSKCYFFQHELVRDTIYGQWLPSIVASVHNSIGVFIELSEGNLRPFYTRLCYHYLMSKTNRDSAFKYTVKTADQYIGVRYYKEGLLYAINAFEMAVTRTELDELLSVVNTALLDIKPTLIDTLLNNLNLSKRSLNNESFRFKDLRKDIKKRIDALVESSSAPMLRPCDKLQWKASYTFDRMASLNENRIPQNRRLSSRRFTMITDCGCCIV